MAVQVIRLDSPQKLKAPAVAVGTFDGMHAGHSAVLEVVRETAASRAGVSVAVTFHPHPRQVLQPDAAPGVLTTLSEKEWRANALGIDVLAVVSFDAALRRLTPEQFVRDFLVERLGAETVVVGYDHEFGKDRSGNLETMQRLGDELGFNVLSVAPTLVDGAPISSTRIRSLIGEGDLMGAARLLDCFYPVAGKVVAGDRRGRELGFPTANVEIDDRHKVLPPHGVYAARAHLPEPKSLYESPGGSHDAVVNIGVRPTFAGKGERVEAHLLDFQGDLYGSTVVLELINHIRGEQAFAGPEPLKHQIGQDIAAAREILTRDVVTQIRR